MTASATLQTDKVGAASTAASAVKRTAVLTCGVISYGIGVAALVTWIASMLGLLAFSGGPLQLEGSAAGLFNLALMIGFGLQHSIMARPAFKEKWTRVIHPAMERSTFVLATGLVLGPVVLLWQPMPSTVWQLQGALAVGGVTALAGLGWAYLFLATFAIDHFELFGLRQVYQYARGREITEVPFKERLMYRFDRHPIMTGALVGMWFAPHMTLDHLLFAVFATVYIMVGVQFEERSLRRQWAGTYDAYRQRVGSIVPTFGGRS